MNKERDKEKKRKKKRKRFNQVITDTKSVDGRRTGPTLCQPFPVNLRSAIRYSNKGWRDRLLIRGKSDVSVRCISPRIPSKTLHKKIKAIFVIMHPATENRALGNCSRIHHFNVLYWNCFKARKWMESQMGKFRTVFQKWKFRLLKPVSDHLIGRSWKLE